MTTEMTARTARSQHPASFKVLDGDPLFQHMQELYNALARRAYELFDGRGHEHGHDLEDWLRAESEFLDKVPVELSEADDHLIVQADMPGFTDKDVEVRVEPQRLIISGQRQQVRDEKTQKTLYSERTSNQVFRMIDLPEEIDPDQVKATLQNGTLEVSLARAHPAKNIPIAGKAA